SENFKFEGFDGYSDTSYFENDGVNDYLVWNNSSEKAITKALPAITNTQTALKFGVERIMSMQGSVLVPTPQELPYKGAFYTAGANELPYLSAISDGADIEVIVNGIPYTYEAYVNSNIVKNAGIYSIKIYDKNASSGGQTIIDCDIINTDSELEHNITLTITKAKVTVTSAWTKVYDKTTAFAGITYNKDITYVVGSDGVIAGTTASISAVFDSPNAGNRTLALTISGVDASNYYLVLGDLVEGEDYQVNGNVYTVSNTVASITPKTINVTGDADKIFDGTTALSNFEITSSDIIAGDSVIVSGNYAGASVGTHSIILSSDNANYIIASDLEATGTISPKPLTAQWEGIGESYTYDKQAHGVSVAVSGMIAGYEEEVTYSNALTAVNAGEYNVQISLKANSNYTLSGTTTTATWTITKKELVVEWQKGSEFDNEYKAVYANTARTLTPVVSGIIEGDDLDYTISGNTATDVGEYTASVSTLTGTAKDNYKLPANATLSWEIVKADVTGITFAGATYIYNAHAQGITLSGTTSQHGVPLDVVYSGGSAKTEQAISGENAGVNVGTYNITATIAETQNYNKLELSAQIVIHKAEIDGVTFASLTEVYDKTEKAISVSGLITSLGDTITATYNISGTTLGNVTVNKVGNDATDAGTYEVTATLDAGDNYVEKELTATLIIRTREIVVNWNALAGNTGVYNGKAQGVELSIGNLVEGDSITLNITNDGDVENVVFTSSSSSTTYTAVNASTKVLEITAIDGASKYNYALPDINLSTSFEIQKREIIIEAWSDGENTYTSDQDISFVYAKTTYTLEPVYAEATETTGIVAGEESSIEIIVAKNSYKDAGDYEATATLRDNANYVMTASTRSWSILAKEVAIDWSNAITTKIYNAQPQIITAQIEGLIGDDTATLVYSGNTATNVGKYTASVTGIENNKNYVLAQDVPSQDWEIKPADITGITLGSIDTVYDSTEYGLTLSKDTTQYDEAIISVTMVTTNKATGAEIADNKVADAGTYLVKATLNAGDNYNELELEGTITITPADIEFITATISGGGEYVYNAKVRQVTAEFISIKGENLTQYGHPVIVTYAGGENNTNGAKNVNNYTISATASAGNNYNTVALSTNVVIKAKNIEIVYALDDFTYDGTDQSEKLTPTINYGATGDDDKKVYDDDKDKVVLTVELVGKDSNNADETRFFNAGAYDLTITCDNHNYNIVNNGATYTMKQIKIDWLYLKGYEVEYNKELHYVGVSTSADIGITELVHQVQLKSGDLGTVTYKYNTVGEDEEYVNEFTGVKYAGTYYIKATIQESGDKDNYDDNANLACVLKINPTALSGFSLSDRSETYNGAEHTLTLNTTTQNGYIDGNYYTQYGEELTLTYTLDGNPVAIPSATNVKVEDGNVVAYKVSAMFAFSGENATELTASYTSLIFNANLLINKANLSGITLEDDTITYDGEAHVLTPTFPATVEGVYPQYHVVGNKVNVILSATHNVGIGDEFNIVTTLGNGASEAKNAGTYNFVVNLQEGEGTIANNYEGFRGLSAKLVIAKANMATIDGDVLEFGKNLFFVSQSATYDTTQMAILLASTEEGSIITSDPITSLDIFPANKFSHVGDKAKVTYTFNGVEGTTKKDAGIYQVVVTLSNENYNNATLTKEATLTINKATIDYYFVGTTLTYDGNLHYVSVSDTQNTYNPNNVTTLTLLGDDKAQVIYTYTSMNNGIGTFSGARNADTYEITATITVNGNANVNYADWGTKTATLVINKYSTTAEWQDQEFTYNGKDQSGDIKVVFKQVDGTYQAMAVTVLGVEGNATDKTEFKDAGTYDATAVSADYANYDISNCEKELVINKYTLNLYFVSTSKEYDTNTYYLLVNSVNSVNISNTLVDKITLPSGEIKIEYTYSREGKVYNGARNAGVYTVTATYNKDPNYNEWSATATLTITKKELEITYTSPISKVYDGTADCTTISVSGIYEADKPYLTHS
ncbi:MAG: hypothetical protein IKB56_00700, partial [Clostridia bacterium]|nr:hypothetical protein [Clostridia bacterium]